jgi:hypothetical protein
MRGTSLVTGPLRKLVHLARHSDTTLVGILTTRARTGELITECREKGIDVADILTTDYAPSFTTNEKKRFNAINTRLRQAKA